MNLVEQLPVLVIVLLTGGYYWPNFGWYVALAQIVGRISYSFTYILYGPNSRKFGALLGGLSLNALALATLGLIINNFIKFV